MPQVFRAMRRDEDGLPTVDRAANAQGIRLETDIDVDDQDNAVVNHKGMSVAPRWRDLPIFRIPKRLGGQGSNNPCCFTTGTGAFQQAAFAAGLELLPDSPTHAVVRPARRAVPAARAWLAVSRSRHPCRHCPLTPDPSPPRTGARGETSTGRSPYCPSRTKGCCLRNS